MDSQALERIEKKLDSIDQKLDSHLDRIAVVEERAKGNRGLIVVGYSLIAGALAFFFKLLLTLKP